MTQFLLRVAYSFFAKVLEEGVRGRNFFPKSFSPAKNSLYHQPNTVEKRMIFSSPGMRRKRSFFCMISTD